MQSILGEIDPEPSKPSQNNDEEEWDFDITDEDKSRVSFRETIRNVVFEFGGARGVAKEYKRNYDAAPAGSATRARMASQLMQNVQDYGEDLELGDEESIEALDVHLRPIYQQEFLERLPVDLREKVAGHLK